MTQLAFVQSFPNRELAEFAQSRLKQQGIDSSLDNATLLGWYWQYGVAVGGVKLFVGEQDLAAASEVLDFTEHTPARSAARCPQCGEAMLPDWEVCWRCAAIEDPTAADQPATRNAESDALLTALAVIATALVAFFSLGLKGLLVVVGIIALVRLTFQLTRELPVDESIVSETSADAAVNTRTELADATAIRAWKAAVLGLCWFPLLTLYAGYLLVRIKPGKIPMSSTGQRRRRLALLVVVTTLSLWLVLGAVMFVAARAERRLY